MIPDNSAKLHISIKSRLPERFRRAACSPVLLAAFALFFAAFLMAAGAVALAGAALPAAVFGDPHHSQRKQRYHDDNNNDALQIHLATLASGSGLRPDMLLV